MSELYIEIDNKDLLDYVLDKDFTGLILPFSFYSLGLNNKNNLLDVAFNNKINKKIGLNLEKIFDDEMLNKVLIDLKPYLKKIDFITFSDFGLFKLLKEAGFNNLIYRAPSYLTNVCDVKLYHELVDNVVLSSEITFDELKHIINNIDFVPFIDCFGLNPIFYSRRPLITNFFDYKNYHDDAKLTSYFIKEETRNKKQRIYEDDNSTTIYDDSYYYLDMELKQLDKDYKAIIHLPFMDFDNGKKIIDAYLNKTAINELELNIPLGKGAYNNKLILRKEEENE